MLRIGTRGSELALTQSKGIADDIEKLTGVRPELLIVKTGGDTDQRSDLASFGGAGAFTREIDEQQRAGVFDLSVHSLKDLPTDGRGDLIVGAVPPRKPVEDCLVTSTGGGLDGLPEGARVGTGSARRRAQLLAARPDLEVTGIRGNVGTRLAKVQSGDVDATLLARAGLLRLGLESHISEILSTDVMLPAAGQGALGLVVCSDREDVLEVLRQLEDAKSRAEVTAERALLGELGGGCHLPVGVLARVSGDRMTLAVRIVSADGKQTLEDRCEGALDQAHALGVELARRIAEAGARELLP